MSKLSRQPWMSRGISLFVAAVFTVTTLIWDPSAALAAVESFALFGQVKFRSEVQNTLYSIPAEIGTVTDVAVGARQTGYQNESLVSSPESRFVVHIQDAHASVCKNKALKYGWSTRTHCFYSQAMALLVTRFV